MGFLSPPAGAKCETEGNSYIWAARIRKGGNWPGRGFVITLGSFNLALEEKEKTKIAVRYGKNQI
jgi:hypothetical protein